MLASISPMLISVFKYLQALQLQVINRCKYVKMVIYHYNRDQHYKIKVGEHVLF